MDVGFTGTQNGMTTHQKQSVEAVICDLRPERARHGMCIGADEQFHYICRRYPIFIVGHPGMDSLGRSPMTVYVDVDVLCEKKLYLDRNTDIATYCDVLVATPKEYEEELRSGTWSTIRRGRKQHKRIIIVYPDGSTGE